MPVAGAVHVCQSLMKSVPPSQVSFGRGEGQGSRGEGAQGLKITGLEISVGELYRNTALTFSLPDFFPSLSLPTVAERIIETIISSFLLLQLCENV